VRHINVLRLCDKYQRIAIAFVLRTYFKNIHII